MSDRFLFYSNAILAALNMPISIALVLCAINGPDLSVRIFAALALWWMGWGYREILVRMKVLLP